MGQSFALRFHRGTNHPGGEFMDPRHTYGAWDRPDLFKRYPGAERIELDQAPTVSGTAALEALTPAKQAARGSVDLPFLSALLHHSAGITKRLRYGDQTIPFRAAACTGALYHIELYAICAQMEGLEAGVYHYDPEHSSLDVLRKGDYRARIAAGNERLAHAPIILAATDVYMRNAVKYQARAYRHAFWDSGTMLANTLAMANAHGQTVELALGFSDQAVAELLGLEQAHEFPLVLVGIGEGAAPREGPVVAPLDLQAEYALKPRFPLIRQMHAATALQNEAQAQEWRRLRYGGPTPSHPTPVPYPTAVQSQAPLEEVIRKRGSSRRFGREPIGWDQLSTILEHTVFPLPWDLDVVATNRVFLIVNSVEGLDPGAYLHGPEGLSLLREGEFRHQAGQLALGQDLAADASVNLYFLCDLESVLESLGERGYRLAHLEGSVMAGRGYLAAYALDLGATGLTFFDDAVAQFFAPEGEGLQVMFLLAMGVPGKLR